MQCNTTKHAKSCTEVKYINNYVMHEQYNVKGGYKTHKYKSGIHKVKYIYIYIYMKQFEFGEN